MKILLLIALILIGSAAAQEQYEGEVRACAEDLKQFLALAESFKADFNSKNTTALIDDAIALLVLAEKANVDCKFGQEDEVKLPNIKKCYEDIQSFIKLIAQIKADYAA